MKYLIGSFDDDFLPILEALEKDTDNILFFDILSFGGDCANEVALLGAIRQAKRRGKTIVTRNRGVAFSAAASVLCSGDKIYLTDYCVTMFHQAYVSTDSHLKDLYYKVKRIVNKIWNKRRDFIDLLGTDLSIHIPINGIAKMHGDSRFHGDYYLLPNDMKNLLPSCVLVEDIPEELLNLKKFNPESEAEKEEADEIDISEELPMLDEDVFLDLFQQVNQEMERRQKAISETITSFNSGDVDG